MKCSCSFLCCISGFIFFGDVEIVCFCYVFRCFKRLQPNPKPESWGLERIGRAIWPSEVLCRAFGQELFDSFGICSSCACDQNAPATTVSAAVASVSDSRDNWGSFMNLCCTWVPDVNVIDESRLRCVVSTVSTLGVALKVSNLTQGLKKGRICESIPAKGESCFEPPGART